MNRGDAETRAIIHDLNNVFAALSGFAELVLEDLQPGTATHAMAAKLFRGQVEAEILVARLAAKMLR